MKKFNFSLVLLLCIGLFFIACEKDVVTPSVEQNAVTSAVEQEKVTSEQGLLIPSSIIIEQGKEFTKSHLAKASEETRTMYAKDFIVAKYLQDVDKLQEVGKVQGEVPFHFSELDLSTYLTQEQLKSLDKNLAKFKPEQLMHKGYCEITQWDPCCCCFKYIESWC